MNEEYFDLAVDIMNYLSSESDINSYSGYYANLVSYAYPGNIVLQLTYEVLRYGDDEYNDVGYFGVWFVPCVEGGEDLIDADWMYTNTYNPEELAFILETLAATYTRKYMWQLYTEVME